ncbi:autotransporter outer membrane beta-barrel domain-containing protein [Brucella gallinifaecis]|uniref:Autotransporter outer membrane beta-barrel domain-containing protein n=1 Tax=Brucella gallinifaecis TaxID=215590 RepID=A0A502BNV0_9HYPH|nr:autotransporter outer membrane beta-barrel domain-containing protein [Brucella gallinifaecis]TPF75419.1 autotransporter outer membrane beta-barrel domain-containing protein [Brucella gallinifaecis]
MSAFNNDNHSGNQAMSAETKAGKALNRTMRTLAASSALNNGSRLVAAALWAAMVAATAATPLILANTNQVKAEDLKGTPGAQGKKGSGRLGGSGGAGNGYGGKGAAGDTTGKGGEGGEPFNGNGGGGGGGGAGAGTAADGGAGTAAGGGAGGAAGAIGGGAGGAGGSVGSDGTGAAANRVGGGGGGGGGAGLFLEEKVTQTTQSGLEISGGKGGDGAGDGLGGGGGGGSGGGAGALVNGQLTNVSGATIRGGAGGAGGAGDGLGGGGGGGDGVAIVGVGSRFENFGTVIGGDGGEGGTADIGANAGAGIRLGHDAYVVNAGVVKAGVSYGADAALHTGAIEIVGDNATLELRVGSDIQGKVNVQSGVKNAVLAIGGADDSTLDVGTGIYAGFSSLTKSGTSKWTLAGETPAITPWRIEDGVLSVATADGLGDVSGTITLAGGTLEGTSSFTLDHDLVVDGTGSGIRVDAGAEITATKAITGATGFTKSGAGKLVFTNEHNVLGGLTVSEGTLAVGNGGIEGLISGNASIANGATLEFNHSNIEVYNDSLSGTGTLKVDSPGGLTLAGDSSAFTGIAQLNGTTTIDGVLGASTVTVGATGELAGIGRIIGNTSIEAGGTLVGVQGTALRIDGNLVTDAGTIINLSLGSASERALFDVGGDLTLKGTMNVSSLGGFGRGLYRVADYAGTLTNAATITTDVTFGTIPAGMNASDLALVATTAHQVSINNDVGATTAFWNGSTLHLGTLNGGSGTWDGNNTNWTNAEGNIANLWDETKFSIFSATGGTVKIDNEYGQVKTTGMQFAVDGYDVTGGALELDNGADAPIIRVGDGTVAGGSITTTIASELQGSHGFTKTDYGTLILTGDNTYSGVTNVENGTLQIGNGGTTGSVAGDIVVGTNDSHEARLVYNRSDDITVDKVISGTGTLVKENSNTLILTGENTYAHGTTIDHGTVQIGNGGTTGSIIGDVDLVNDDSRLVINRSNDLTLDGTFEGKGGLTQSGTGKTTLTNEQFYTGETDITAGELILAGNGSIKESHRVKIESGAVLDVTGANGLNVDVQSLDGKEGSTVRIGDKTLNITDSKDDTYAGIIAGDDGHVNLKKGQKRLTGENTYTGGTGIDEGATLIIGDGGTKGSVQGEIAVAGTLIYDRSDRYTVNELEGKGELELKGGGTAVIDKKQKLNGEYIIDEGNTLALEGDGDISEGKGVTSNGKFDIKDSDLDEIRIAHLRGGENGEVDLGAKTLVITDGDGSEFAGSGINGSGGFIVEKGKQLLSGDNSYTGDTLIKSGAELQLGNDHGREGSITSNVVNEGILSGSGSMNDLHNQGIVSPGTDANFGTLTVKGNYSSDGGKLILHEELADDTTKGDRLVIAGNTSGTTEVTVVNRGGWGDQTVNGVEVISVGGQSDGVFTLNGDYVNYRGEQAVVGGAYAYTLEKGGVNTPDGNYYLRSQMKDYNPGPNPEPKPEYQVGVGVYGGASSALSSLNRGGFASFGSRMKARGAGTGADSGSDQNDDQNDDEILRSKFFWGQVTGGYSFLTPNGNATDSTYGSHDWRLQAGLDGQLMDNASGSLFGSMWLDYTRSNIDVWSRVGNGKVKVNGYGFGGALTWYGENGFYLDGQGKVSWYKSDMESALLNEQIASGVKSFGYALSLEAGQAFALNDRWTLTPQAQLIWSSLNTDDYRDVFNAFVNTPDSQTLTGRIGFAADYATSWIDTDGTTTRLNVGGLANIYQELKSGSNYITVSDIRVASGTIEKTWGEIGATANYSWANDTYSVFGKASVASSLQNFGDNYSVTGNVGFRVKW